MAELGDSQLEWATRILRWLACSFRLLKIYEVQDGITLHPKNTLLDNETKPESSIVDICKPFIEEGPGGTIDFVHYSAKE